MIGIYTHTIAFKMNIVWHKWGTHQANTGRRAVSGSVGAFRGKCCECTIHHKFNNDATTLSKPQPSFSFDIEKMSITHAQQQKTGTKWSHKTKKVAMLRACRRRLCRSPQSETIYENPIPNSKWLRESHACRRDIVNDWLAWQWTDEQKSLWINFTTTHMYTYAHICSFIPKHICTYV